MVAFGYRVLSSSVIIAALTLLVMYSRGPAAILVPLVFGVLVVTALLEFYYLAERKGFKPMRAAGVVFSIAYVCWLYWFARMPLDQYQNMMLISGSAVAVLIGALVLVTMVALVFRGQTDGALATLGSTLAGFVCVTWLLSFVMRIILWSNVPKGTNGFDGRWFFLYFVVLLKSTDIAAYIVGTLLGRHKLAPAISPKKTIEGSVAGLIVSTMLGVVLVRVLPSVSTVYGVFNMSGVSDVGSPLLPYVLGGATGLLLSILGQLGDLTESMWKRDAGMKDSGGYIPGMGGVLDLLDSFLFAAPAMCVIMTMLQHAFSSCEGLTM